MILLIAPSMCLAEEARISPYNLLENIKVFSKTDTSNKTDNKKKSKRKREHVKKQDKIRKEKPVLKEESIPNLDITIQQNANRTLITFPWKKPVGVTVYESSNYLWVIFDKKSSIKVDILNDFIENAVITHPVVENYIIPNIGDKASCIMLKLNKKTDENKNFLISKRNNFIDLSIGKYKAKVNNIDVMPKPFDINQKIEFNIENLKNTSIVSFIDPIVGNKMSMLTINDLQYNIENNYIFTDLDIIKSMQGIVIREKSDNLQMNKNNSSFWITSKSGLNISAKYASSKGTESFQSPQFYRFQQFQGKSGIVTLEPYVRILAQFNKIERKLQKQLYSSSIDEECNIRMNLALLYLANGYLPEATAHLEYSYKFYSPLFRDNYDFLLLYAVAKFMENKFQEAQKIISLIDISSVPVGNIEEVQFWQSMINISNNNSVYLSYEFINDFFKKNGKFLKNYPQNILSKIKFLAIEYLFKNKEYDAAESTIALLSTFDLNQKGKARLYYEKANLYEQTTKKHKTIMESLSQCIDSDNSLYYSSLCKFKMVNIQLKAKVIDINEAIKQLQSLDLDTRNSELEIGILEKLGSLFYDNKDYVNALLTWRVILDYYLDSPNLLAVINSMGSTFVDIFLRDLGNYTSFQKVAIFDEFSNLNPIGIIGDEVALKLSDSLIDLDLLERASEILKHQVKYRLHGFFKEKALNQLLELYLELGQAKKILKLFEEGKVDHSLDQSNSTRRYIYAKAFAQEKQYHTAIKILKGDFSNQADMIRLNIYWKIQNWKAFNDNSEPHIYSLMQNNLPLTAKDAERVLMQAISYSFLNKTDLLDNLLSNFKERLLEKHKGTLDVIDLLIKLQYQGKNKVSMINTEYIQKAINDVYDRMKK